MPLPLFIQPTSPTFHTPYLPNTLHATYLSDTLHRAANLLRCSMEPVEVPAWDLGHDVVQTGFEAGSGGHGSRIRDGRQRDT